MRGKREGGDTGLRFKTGEFIGTKQCNRISRESHHFLFDQSCNVR